MDAPYSWFAAMSDAIFRLLHEHKEFDTLLARIEERVRSGDWAKAQQCFYEAEQAIYGHFELEEGQLFPAFEKATGILQGPTEVMREEHHAIRELFEDCRASLFAQEAQNLLSELDTLLILVQQHNVKEEYVLYPMCRMRIPDLDVLLAGAVPAAH